MRTPYTLSLSHTHTHTYTLMRVWMHASLMDCRKSTYHHLVEGDPAVGREVLQHGHQELEAAVPVAQQQHHANQVEDAHHRTGQVIGHMEDLIREDRGRDRNKMVV